MNLVISPKKKKEMKIPDFSLNVGFDRISRMVLILTLVLHCLGIVFVFTRLPGL